MTATNNTNNNKRKTGVVGPKILHSKQQQQHEFSILTTTSGSSSSNSRGQSLAKGWISGENNTDENEFVVLDQQQSKPSSLTASENKMSPSSLVTAAEEEQQSSSSATTRVGKLSQAFSSVLQGDNDIDMVELLSASKQFVTFLREIGQGAVAGEFERNVAKAQALYQTAAREKRQTMASLLQYEKDTGIHDKTLSNKDPSNTLKDPSGAMGLIWMRHTLSLSYHMYQSLLITLDDDDTSAVVDTKTLALQAYQKALEPHHNWALRKIYRAGIGYTTPSYSELLSRLFGTAETATKQHATILLQRDMHQLVVQTWQPLLQEWKRIFVGLGLECY